MIDLHVHSNFSDGSNTIEEILKEAQVKGLSLLSISDHNVVSAYEKLKDKSIRNLFDGKIVSGIEITTSIDSEIIEVLGYDFDVEKLKEQMKGNVLSYEDYKIKEFNIAKQNYLSRGIVFNEENLNFNSKLQGCRVVFFEELFKHDENINRLLNKSSLESLSKFTRNEFYNPKSDFYVDQSLIYPSLSLVIDMIHNAGGLVFLAHPFEFSKNITDKLQNVIDRFHFDGLECYYSTFTSEQTEYLISLCKKNNLFVSGGSDYHGKKRLGVSIGIGLGNLKVDKDKCSKWTNNIKNYI